MFWQPSRPRRPRDPMEREFERFCERAAEVGVWVTVDAEDHTTTDSTLSIVRDLRARGYPGWYVLEQDTILTEEPTGEGPLTDVRTSVEYLRGLLA